MHLKVIKMTHFETNLKSGDKNKLMIFRRFAIVKPYMESHELRSRISINVYSRLKLCMKKSQTVMSD